jgi:hypothetical protein
MLSICNQVLNFIFCVQAWSEEGENERGDRSGTQRKGSCQDQGVQ